MDGKDEKELGRLLRAAIAGDAKAYALFLQRIAALIRGFAQKRIVRGGIDPEDIVQETLLAIHVKRHTWMSDAPVLPWVYAIARHKLIDAFRRRGSHVEIDIGDIAETLAQPQTAAVSEHDVRLILGSLSAGQRAVVTSISVDGHSIGETAKRLAMTETAVRVTLHRGLRAIARRYGRS